MEDTVPADFEQAFPALYRQARSVAWRLLGNPTEAEDAAAEALARTLVAWKKVGALDYREAWVSRVTSNVSIDILRRRHLTASHLEPVDDFEHPDAMAVAVDVRAALARLPRRQAEVLVLRWIAGLSEDEVATVLHVSRSAVRTHATRGRDAMRRHLGGGFEYVAL